MVNELVLCYCKSCNRHACTASNSWTQRDPGFFNSGESKHFAKPGLITSGQRIAVPGNLKDCLFQSLLCAGCEATVGWICVEASKGKAKYRSVVLILPLPLVARLRSNYATFVQILELCMHPLRGLSMCLIRPFGAKKVKTIFASDPHV